MKGLFEQFIERVRKEARKRLGVLSIKSMGKERQFFAYDWGGDTFIFEKDIWKQLNTTHAPILIVRKGDLVKNASGFLMTLTTGNHSVAAIPLLSGQFWSLGRVAPSQRSAILRERIVCANAVNHTIEISQRDVPTQVVVQADEWLQSMGCPLNLTVMAERNDNTLEYYRSLGQEWRIKPLAWTREEIDFAIRVSKTRIGSLLHYYHSAKGVHFLSYTEFHKLTQFSMDEFPQLVTCLRELVSIFDGNTASFMRTPKIYGHHEVELFGVRRGIAEKGIVPELEKLMESITLKRVTPEDVFHRIQQIDQMIRSSLERPALADETSQDFAETLYMHLTGEIYYTHNDLGSLAFDDRRTALPGATFRGGRADFHPGADERTRILLANVEQMLSQDEVIEYANLYEVRSAHSDEDHAKLGEGDTREILFKTNRSPLCTSLIEKRLALNKRGYGDYMLARVKAFKALGVALGNYRLLMRNDFSDGKVMNYFIRNRCDGEPLDEIPPRLLRKANGEPGEDPHALAALSGLLGNAAAQNLVMKKFIQEENGCRFGVGKEVFASGFDFTLLREMPTRVSLCSVRGCLGWPDLSQTQENLDALFHFYLPRYAKTLHTFWLKHKNAVTLDRLTERFFDGFELKTREMHWNYMVRREQFDAFDPHLPFSYGFTKKWKFALWALDRQFRRIKKLRVLFSEAVSQIATVADKTVSKESEPC